jgi:pimeloyl-ACP methyl ester carboxylesterase
MKAKINDANLYYEIHGRGDPLLMIQGWGMDITGWETVVEPLSKVFQVIVLTIGARAARKLRLAITPLGNWLMMPLHCSII